MPLLGMCFRHLGSVLQGVAPDLEDPGLLSKGPFKVEARALLVHRRRQKISRDLEGRGKRSVSGGGAALESRSVSEGDPRKRICRGAGEGEERPGERGPTAV